MKSSIKKILPALLLALLSVMLPSLSSCTNPDGDTGDWGGTWLIESIYIDGQLNTSYPDGDTSKVMVSFQGKLFSMLPADGLELIGTWEESGDKLTLNGGWGAGQTEDWPWRLGFGNEKILTFTVVRESSKRVEWTLQCSDGHLRVYHLRKI